MQSIQSLKGVFTALITPFFEGAIDYKSLEKLVEFQVENGIDGFVINGTTAESPTLTILERREIFSVVKSLVPKDFPLVFGTGGNSTAHTIHDTQQAQEWGADASLVVVPYYNRPPQRGLLAHFTEVANSCDMPMLLYNVPSRTITGLEVDTIQALSQHKNIVGIKEATGNIEFDFKIRTACGNDFLLLSGDDGTYDDFMHIAKGDGVISVASHIIPKAMKNLDIQAHKDLISSLFVEANPIPVKMALYQMQIIRSPELRLPLVALSDEKALVMFQHLSKAGLL